MNTHEIIFIVVVVCVVTPIVFKIGIDVGMVFASENPRDDVCDLLWFFKCN